MKKCPQCGRDIPNGINNCQGCGYNGYSYAKTQNSNEQTKKIVLIIFGAIFFLIIVSSLFMFGTAKVFFSFLFDQINEMQQMEDNQNDIKNQSGDMTNDMIDQFEENKNDFLENFGGVEITFEECKNKCGEDYMYVNGLCACNNLDF